MGVKSVIFHTFVLVHHVFTLKSSDDLDLSESTDKRVVEMKEFATKYFTTWNMMIQLVYFLIALQEDFVKIIFKGSSSKLEVKIKKLKGLIFMIAFPCTIYVSSFFWGMYAIDREWVLPETADDFVPKWLNHSLHTNIFIFLTIEMLISKQVLPSFKIGFVLLTFLNIIYDIVFLYTYYESGRWIYGIFYVLNWTQRIGLLIVNYLASIVFLKAGTILYEMKNNKQLIKKTS